MLTNWIFSNKALIRGQQLGSQVQQVESSRFSRFSRFVLTLFCHIGDSGFAADNRSHQPPDPSCKGSRWFGTGHLSAA